MSNRHKRILDGFIHTQLWADLSQKERENVNKLVTTARNLLSPKGVRWFSNIINRGATVLSIDDPDDGVTSVALPGTLSPDGKKATYKFDFPAKPSSLWLNFQKSSFVDVAEPIAPGIYTLKNNSGTVAPGSNVDFNTGTITIVLARPAKPGSPVPVMKTMPRDGAKFNRWRYRRNRIVQRYPEQRVLSDFNFFFNTQKRGEFFTVLKTLVEASARNQVLRAALENMSWLDANGLDMPAGNAGGGAADDAGTAYGYINGLLKHLAQLEKLPRGDMFLKNPDGSYWTLLDVGYSEIEGGLLGHCGNAGPHANDRIMSLRYPDQGMAGYYTPKVTFIYDGKRKAIGQMKGASNSKPKEEYHDSILNLLLNSKHKIDYLSGTDAIGRTYKLHTNFSLNDFSDDKLVKLWNANPELILKTNEKGSEYQPLTPAKKKALEKAVGPIDWNSGKKAKKSRQTDDNED